MVRPPGRGNVNFLGNWCHWELPILLDYGDDILFHEAGWRPEKAMDRENLNWTKVPPVAEQHGDGIRPNAGIRRGLGIGEPGAGEQQQGATGELVEKFANCPQLSARDPAPKSFDFSQG
jgi:hypothetical protein